MNFGEISISGMIMIVVISFAAIGFLKGALKLFYGFLCLVGTLVAGWAGYQFGYPWLELRWPDMPEYGQYACAILAASLTFFLLKTVTGFFFNPIPDDDRPKGSSGILGMLIGMALGVMLCAFTMQRIIENGAKAEMDYWVSYVTDAKPDKLPNLSKLKHNLLNSPVGKRLANYIASSKAGEQNLLKLAIMQAAAPDKFAQLAENPALQDAINNPLMQSFLTDPEVIKSIENGDTQAILENPKLSALLANPEMNRVISEIDIEQALKLR